MNKINPSIKIIYLIISYIYLIYFNNLTTYMIIISLNLILLLLSKFSFKYFLQYFLYTNYLLIFYIIFSLIVKSESLVIPYIIMQLYGLFLIGVVVILTTTSEELVAGIEKILKPLAFFRINYLNFLFSLEIAIRFLPEIRKEYQRIRNIQKTKGISYRKINLLARINNLLSLIIPVINGVFKKVDNLSLSVTMRKYNSTKLKTNIYDQKVKVRDFIFIIIIICLYYVNR